MRRLQSFCCVCVLRPNLFLAIYSKMFFNAKSVELNINAKWRGKVNSETLSPKNRDENIYLIGDNCPKLKLRENTATTLELRGICLGYVCSTKLLNIQLHENTGFHLRFLNKLSLTLNGKVVEFCARLHVLKCYFDAKNRMKLIEQKRI